MEQGQAFQGARTGVSGSKDRRFSEQWSKWSKDRRFSGARTGVSVEQGQAFQWIDYGRLASLAEWLNLSHDGPILTLARVRGQYKQSWRPAK